MNTYTVTTREGKTLFETFIVAEAWNYFYAYHSAYAIYNGVDLLEVKEGK